MLSRSVNAKFVLYLDGNRSVSGVGGGQIYIDSLLRKKDCDIGEMQRLEPLE